MSRYVNSVAAAVLLAVLLRGCMVQGFKVPSGSMLPTLLIGDYIFASRIEYGIAAPLIDAWIWRWGTPQPGDVVVLARRGEPGRLYVKRVVGVAGEILEARDGALSADGRPRRVLPEWVAPGQLEDFGPVRVPPGHVFVLGDNRDQSIDSRNWGPVETAGIKGRVFLIYWSQRKSGGGVRWERLGSWVQ